MAEDRLKAWRIDRKIPIAVWIAAAGIGIVAFLVGEAMLINAVGSYQPALAQYLHDHFAIDEVQFRALPPVQPPSDWAYSEGSFGATSLLVGLALASMAALVRLMKVRVRWIAFRSLVALVMAICSAVSLVNVLPHNALEFDYVNSGVCVEGCFYIPQPIDGWFDTVAIALLVSLLLSAGLAAAAFARSLPRTTPATGDRRP
jgi:hypothetical protein